MSYFFGRNCKSNMSHRKFGDVDGNKSFWKARYVTMSIDISPKGLRDISRSLHMEQGLLRFYTMRVKTSADRLPCKNYLNIYKHVGLDNKVSNL